MKDICFSPSSRPSLQAPLASLPTLGNYINYLNYNELYLITFNYIELHLIKFFFFSMAFKLGKVNYFNWP